MSGHSSRPVGPWMSTHQGASAVASRTPPSSGKHSQHAGLQLVALRWPSPGATPSGRTQALESLLAWTPSRRNRRGLCTSPSARARCDESNLPAGLLGCRRPPCEAPPVGLVVVVRQGPRLRGRPLQRHRQARHWPALPRHHCPQGTVLRDVPQVHPRWRPPGKEKTWADGGTATNIIITHARQA